MDPSMMNDTRKLLGKIKQSRDDLPKTDGKTKERVEGWRKNVHQLTGDLKKQVKYFDNMDNGDQGGGGAGGDIRRDYFSLLAGRLQKDIEYIFDICQKVMAIENRKNISNQETIENWKILRNTLMFKISSLFEKDQNSDKFFMISKLLNLRESLIRQIFHSCLYRKLVIWKDLNIHIGDYAPQVVVDTINMYNNYKETLKYIPTRLQFQEVNLDSPGFFSFDNQSDQAESSDVLNSLINHFIDMESLIKKNFLMASEKIFDYLDSNPVQVDLRREIEIIQNKLLETDSQFKKLRNKIQSQNNEAENANQADIKQQLDKVQGLYNNELYKSQKIQQLLDSSKASERKLKLEVASLKDQVSKYENHYIPKLKETKKYQKELKEALEEIKRDSELLPSMFRAEANFRKECKREKDEAISNMVLYQKEHNKLVNERDDLKNELERKERLAIQAIAARGNIKQHLDEEKLKNGDLLRKIEDLHLQIEDSQKEVQKFKNKHDEMFKSVSGLNARIEELESHKLNLLEQLKKSGDRGDLTYIVKTQGLSKIQAKEMKDRVVLEDYQPEKNRSQKDKEYAEKMEKDEKAAQEKQNQQTS